MIVILLALALQAAATQPNDGAEIVVEARRYRGFSATVVRQANGKSSCTINRSSTYSSYDKLACDAMIRCNDSTIDNWWTPQRLAWGRASKANERSFLRQWRRENDRCFASERRPLVRQFLAERRERERGAQ